MLSLLNDKELFGDINNLDINPDNPFGYYKAPDNVLSTVNSGMRYQEAYKAMIKDPDSEVLIPIIFACDETKVGSLGKATSWPLMFTTSILYQNKKQTSCLETIGLHPRHEKRPFSKWRKTVYNAFENQEIT